MTITAKSPVLQQQYAAWPYPQVPLLASLPSTHPWQLHADWLWDRCGSGPAPARPRIWIAGCGTFQPYVFGTANPRAEILATDFSEPSLHVARRRCRLRAMRHVQFAACDIDDKATWPDGEFDLIECYGVLMNLRDPQAALRGLGQRLSSRGVLRLMVYPYWSRSRIFQLQRIARLLGLSAADRADPHRFRRLVLALPRSHPLRHAFTNYSDSKNDAGIVDAFLHAGDRGFTGHQLGELIAGAGLSPAFWFHRPWAQPAVMAERLQLVDRSQGFVLGYLDLWQELRGNFVVCLRRQDAPAPVQGAPRAHPLFDGSTGGLRHRLRLSALRLLGGRLPSRTDEEPIRLSASDARALRNPRALDDATRARLGRHGMLLGAPLALPDTPTHGDWPDEDRFLAAAGALRIGNRAPNPLYHHLFAAFELAQRCPDLGLPDLDTQLGRWLPWADPLEQRPVHFGLTPYGTMSRCRIAITEHLQQRPLPVAGDWSAVRLRQDATARQQVKSLLRAFELQDPAGGDAALRELWCLLFGHDQLFLRLQ